MYTISSSPQERKAVARCLKFNHVICDKVQTLLPHFAALQPVAELNKSAQGHQGTLMAASTWVVFLYSRDF